MSISSALNNAITGLTASSRMAEVVSSNLSNVMTDGYGRRSVELSSLQLGQFGGGVRVEGINRFVDAGLLADRRLADAAMSANQQSVDALTRLEQQIGGPDDAGSIGAKLAAFETALIRAASDPASDLRLADVALRLGDVAQVLRDNTQAVQGSRQAADAAIDKDINELNAALVQVGELNKDVLRLKSSGADPSALFDARQQIVDKIADIVPLRQIERDNGTIALMTPNGTTLLDARAVEFGFVRTPTITGDMTFASGALSGITLDGVAIDPATGIGRLGGGSLGASFELRDSTLVTVQSSLDEIAADLIARFEDPATDPTLVPGDTGLLTDEGGPLDLADIPGLAGRIAINAAIDYKNGGDPSLLRDGLNAATAGPTGNPAQFNNLLDALQVPRADLPGAAITSAFGRIADFTSQLGTMRLGAQEKLSYAAARWDTLHEAELANGVDTDIELQTLMLIEQAYAANAKVIETADFMMQRLMEI
ncbi:flagellar hook-associated protein 1 FlgK [Yoonia tamlensis]|uniref:Flagellar hook-associated protein 1 n=1 Tax=Yoonia tamlensis TaxID=390270 RepID=A0A1I6HC16_9RHOB|nr:flagellar hook-associated protein FlgK [Yoonia tamlensis]SFR51979.1 flagellar hook-associated protein 1 FlgK [Yoonia tamlensis]